MILQSLGRQFRESDMNRINPKQAIALICVLLAIVVVIHNEQNRRERQKEATIAEQQRKTEETVAAQKAAQKQQELQKQQEAAAQKAAEDAANAHAEFLARFTNTNFTRNPGIETVAVAVADESGTMNHTVGAALVNRCLFQTRIGFRRPFQRRLQWVKRPF
jgi:FKBP-type peptidyl-prolyl cis-trans isomerase